jgi:hypothetical protein
MQNSTEKSKWWKIIYKFITHDFHDFQRLARNIKAFKDKIQSAGLQSENKKEFLY